MVTPSAAGSPGVSFTPVITGLNAPRGVAFDGQGSLYVAESGQYLSDALGFHLSSTGKVTKYRGSTFTPAWSTPFSSVYDTEHGPEVLGPEGISAIGSGCMKHSAGQRNGCQVKMIMSESTTGLAAAGLPDATQAGRLYRLDGATGTATSISDVGDQQYQWTADHKSLQTADFPDSNPYGVLVTKDPATDAIRTFVADAGANTISEIAKDGSNRIIAYIPNDPVSDSTPTCISQGPDGMLYVGTLDLVYNLFVPGGPNRSAVWRVDPNANFSTIPTVWATGLTTVTSCTFDRAGNFWATEMFQPTQGAPGDIVTIPFSSPATLTRIGAEDLPLPGGIAQGPDGSMYVSVNSANTEAGVGAIVKVTS
ncbi:ScyD/ScyE family protein [Rhodococcus antarcticus]|uniref:ScyD/ScyE family protein n=1 Tax=Rhodococcus antarcticus TaxID=2987751 RepID=A0ABY6P4S1_9NOCA|nr:ScyD/ScyE family protein [Rhodococcus antarcticus]UZJ26523.1 ScyD/ScyE family protein [Rhodococcus antarcticus]